MIWNASLAAPAGLSWSTRAGRLLMLAIRHTCRYVLSPALEKFRSHLNFDLKRASEMIIDFEHHYIPAELGRRLGMDPTRKEAVKTHDATVHAQLFDLEAQLRDMDRVGIDVAVQSCILGWDTTLENCRLISICLPQMQKEYHHRFVGLGHALVLEQAG